MNAIEKLLKLDASKLQMPTKEVEVKRLSDLLGEQFIVKIKGISSDKLDEIRDMAIKDDVLDVNEVRKATVLSGIAEPNLRDEELCKHIGAATPYDLVDKLFLPGEKDALYEQINKLSGYNEGAVEDIKN
ncbi:XkdN-like protein [Robertmurraya korlensis]|uniref:phage tail assembly chaperone n=1 Tax=Robertmurraya korlensis TaxID=519977 RepID=UPI00203D755B|nr:XkdN-like protein [Robertmurraya korlensis]MCM3599394.1 XkdN-like protein [Robertmurraya korlensis]